MIADHESARCPIGGAVLWTPGDDRPEFIDDPHPQHRAKTEPSDYNPIPYHLADLAAGALDPEHA